MHPLLFFSEMDKIIWLSTYYSHKYFKKGSEDLFHRTSNRLKLVSWTQSIFRSNFFQNWDKYLNSYYLFMGFPGGSAVRKIHLQCRRHRSWEFIRSLGQDDLLEEEMATHSSILGLPLWFRWQSICLQCRRLEFSPCIGKGPLEKEMATHSLKYSCLENSIDTGAWLQLVG